MISENLLKFRAALLSYS